MKQIEGKLDIHERLNNSRNGNPRYRVTIVTDNYDVYLVDTKYDSSLCYSLSNHNGKQVVATLGDYRGNLTLLDIEANY